MRTILSIKPYRVYKCTYTLTTPAHLSVVLLLLFSRPYSYFACKDTYYISHQPSDFIHIRHLSAKFRLQSYIINFGMITIAPMILCLRTKSTFFVLSSHWYRNKTRPVLPIIFFLLFRSAIFCPKLRICVVISSIISKFT